MLTLYVLATCYWCYELNYLFPLPREVDALLILAWVVELLELVLLPLPTGRAGTTTALLAAGWFFAAFLVPLPLAICWDTIFSLSPSVEESELSSVTSRGRRCGVIAYWHICQAIFSAILRYLDLVTSTILKVLSLSTQICACNKVIRNIWSIYYNDITNVSRYTLNVLQMHYEHVTNALWNNRSTGILPE
jgi:hypothetical protein